MIQPRDLIASECRMIDRPEGLFRRDRGQGACGVDRAVFRSPSGEGKVVCLRAFLYRRFCVCGRVAAVNVFTFQKRSVVVKEAYGVSDAVPACVRGVIAGRRKGTALVIDVDAQNSRDRVTDELAVVGRVRGGVREPEDAVPADGVRCSRAVIIIVNDRDRHGRGVGSARDGHRRERRAGVAGNIPDRAGDRIDRKRGKSA